LILQTLATGDSTADLGNGVGETDETTPVESFGDKQTGLGQRDDELTCNQIVRGAADVGVRRRRDSSRFGQAGGQAVGFEFMA